MPAPTCRKAAACSNNCASIPRDLSASAVVIPPIPPPAIRILGFLLDIYPPKRDLQARPDLEAALRSQTPGRVRRTESHRLGCEAPWPRRRSAGNSCLVIARRYSILGAIGTLRTSIERFSHEDIRDEDLPH